MKITTLTKEELREYARGLVLRLADRAQYAHSPEDDGYRSCLERTARLLAMSEEEAFAEVDADVEREMEYLLRYRDSKDVSVRSLWEYVVAEATGEPLCPCARCRRIREIVEQETGGEAA